MTPCQWCGQMHPLKICPHVKAINYHRPVEGRPPEVARVEFREPQITMERVPLVGVVGDPEERIRKALRKMDAPGYLSEEKTVVGPTPAMMGAGVGAYLAELARVIGTGYGLTREEVTSAMRDNADGIVLTVYQAMADAFPSALTEERIEASSGEPL